MQAGQKETNDQPDRVISTRTEDLFFNAMELETETERNDFLEQACLGNETLRKEVEWMCKSRIAEDFFLAQPDPCIPARSFIDIIADHLSAFEKTTSE